MCARFVTTGRYGEIIEDFSVKGAPPSVAAAGYNIAPSSDIAAITRNGENRFVLARWGLLPPWADDPRRPMINARAETIDEKKSFSLPFRKHRVIIPADGFYEWHHSGGRKQPWYFRLRSGRPMGMAGIVSPWKPKDGPEILTASIITTAADSTVGRIHERMPAILLPEQAERWLSGDGTDMQSLKALLTPLGNGLLEGYPVSTGVNSTSFDSPENIVPVDR